MSQTYLGRLFTSEFLLKQFYTPEVTAGNWHNISDFIYNGEKITKSPSFDFLKIFNTPVKECNKLAQISIKGQKYVSGNEYYSLAAIKEFPEVKGGFFFNDKTAYLFIINRLQNSYTIKNINISEKAFKIEEITTISPESTDKKGFGSRWHRNDTQKINSIKEIVIKPYSLNRIKINLQK